jgi:hypothetical protein
MGEDKEIKTFVKIFVDSRNEVIGSGETKHLGA